MPDFWYLNIVSVRLSWIVNALSLTFWNVKSEEALYGLCWSGRRDHVCGAWWPLFTVSLESSLDLLGSQLLRLESLLSGMGVGDGCKAFTGEIGRLLAEYPAILAGLLGLLASVEDAVDRSELVDGDVGVFPALLMGLLKFFEGEVGRLLATLAGLVARIEPGGNGRGLRTPGVRASWRFLDEGCVVSEERLNRGDGPLVGNRKFGDEAEGCNVELEV